MNLTESAKREAFGTEGGLEAAAVFENIFPGVPFRETAGLVLNPWASQGILVRPEAWRTRKSPVLRSVQLFEARTRPDTLRRALLPVLMVFVTIRDSTSIIGAGLSGLNTVDAS